MNERATVDFHWSFWLVSSVGLIFNLFGCMNLIIWYSRRSKGSGWLN